MKTMRRFSVLVAVCACLFGAPAVHAVTNIFFTGSQTATLIVFHKKLSNLGHSGSLR